VLVALAPDASGRPCTHIYNAHCVGGASALLRTLRPRLGCAGSCGDNAVTLRGDFVARLGTDPLFARARSCLRRISTSV